MKQKAWQCIGECGMIQIIDDDDVGPEQCENCNGSVVPVTVLQGWER